MTEPHKEGNILPKENLIIVRKIIEKGHSMGITIEELKKLDKNTYQIIDIRDENEIAHGAIPGAVATPADSIEGNENIDFSKKYLYPHIPVFMLSICVKSFILFFIIFHFIIHFLYKKINSS